MMFAVIEFEGRETAVVPMIWLLDNNKHCYWPKCKSQKELDKLVQAATLPNASWPFFPVKKTVYCAGNLLLSDNVISTCF